ncbi:hypothetical protein CRUP_020636 [Coryphaenoides rupestris]|nr:hypothetical protein CRUP_020636 [Coryphaenoides rupestris]
MLLERENSPARHDGFLSMFFCSFQSQVMLPSWLLCYKCITNTMQELVAHSKAGPAEFEQMLHLAQRSQDELFHITLYNWLIEADLTDKLLEVNSPYLEDHLKRMNTQEQSQVRNMDLLWRYYEKSRNFGKAAHVLAHLAEMRSTEISLQQRLEYVSRAILSAKSSSTLSTQGADGEFLHQLEEKMEVGVGVAVGSVGVAVVSLMKCSLEV